MPNTVWWRWLASVVSTDAKPPTRSAASRSKLRAGAGAAEVVQFVKRSQDLLRDWDMWGSGFTSWPEVLWRRSAIQFLLDLHLGLELGVCPSVTNNLLRELEVLDEGMRGVDGEGSFLASRKPEGLPAKHWWARAVQAARMTDALAVTDAVANPAEAIRQRLQARQDARISERQQRQAALGAQADPREDVSDFLAGFSADHARLAARSEALAAAAAAGGEQQTAADRAGLLSSLDALAADVASLEAGTAASAYFLPPYELRAASAAAAELRARVAGAKAALAPKRRFAFAKADVRRSASAAPGAPAAQEAAAPDVQPPDQAAPGAGAGAGAAGCAPPLSAQDQALVASGRGLAGLRGRRVVLRGAALGGAFVLHDLQDCAVVLLGPLSALRLQALRDCTVAAGPVAGATFVSGAEGCTLMLASHQVRIHDAVGCDFYLRVRSRPIIEHSTGLRFAPYDGAAALQLALEQPPEQAQERLGQEQPREQLQELLQQQEAWLAGAALGVPNELWRCVDDFGWVKASQSPHWAVLPEAERRPPPPRAGLLAAGR
ncbi:hypothetical protein HT031_003477 [Scenedesmus sp. PABB004]|nr:hypothetical protein HT031_003477 [Scenedesmus sp. PABB004]